MNEKEILSSIDHTCLAVSATLSDIKLFKKHISPSVKIKAAGGIRTMEDAQSFIQAGADRIGASAIIKNQGAF